MDQTMDFLLAKRTMQKGEIVISPWDIVPIKHSKAAKETTEAHLEVVWINNNCLSSLAGLQGNFRIKHLFAQNNKIKSIDNVLDKLKYLETIVIYDNELRDLDKILRNLRFVKNLKHLDLFDNPAAHEPNYKTRVLFETQTLEILDRHKVSIVEKDKAVKFMSDKKNPKKTDKQGTKT